MTGTGQEREISDDHLVQHIFDPIGSLARAPSKALNYLCVKLSLLGTAIRAPLARSPLLELLRTMPSINIYAAATLGWTRHRAGYSVSQLPSLSPSCHQDRSSFIPLSDKIPLIFPRGMPCLFLHDILYFFNSFCSYSPWFHSNLAAFWQFLSICIVNKKKTINTTIVFGHMLCVSYVMMWLR